MREQHVILTDTMPGKFEGEPPMTSYMYHRVSEWDDQTANDVGAGWAGRKGRRVVIERTDGFVTSFKFADVDTASAYFGIVKAFYQDDLPALT